jgi:hypothetical protein
MNYLINIIVILFFAQLFDYLSSTSYAQIIGYDYKYFPISVRRQIVLFIVSAFLFIAVTFADPNSPPLWIIALSVFPISIYIYFLTSDLIKGNPKRRSDDTHQTSDHDGARENVDDDNSTA